MDVLTFSVSAMNDVEEVAEWLDPFYASLSFHSDEFDSFDHYIVLNEGEPEKAKNHIKKIFSRYNLNFYTSHFKVSNFSGDDHTGLQHSNTLNEHFIDLRKKFKLSSYDVVKIQEFDVIYERGYGEFLNSIRFILNSFEGTLVGSLLPVKYYLPEEGIANQELRKFLADTDLKQKQYNDIKIYQPRVYPHYLAFHPDTFSNLEDNIQHFRRKGSVAEIQNLLVNKLDNFYMQIREDTGADFFNEWFRKNQFFHVKENKVPFTHIKSVAMYFHRLIRDESFSFDQNWINKDQIKSKFRKVKRYEHLPFHSDSIFEKSYKKYKDSIKNYL